MQELNDSTEQTVVRPVEIAKDITIFSTERVKIYPTNNNYNFLESDTRTGRIYGIQWNIEDSDGFGYSINLQNLVSDYDIKEWVSSRFEIYPTKNS